MVDTSIWNTKVKFTNLPANFILLQVTGSLLHETESSVGCFSFCSVYITKKKQNTPPQKITLPYNANRIGQ